MLGFEKEMYTKAQNSTVTDNSDKYMVELGNIIDEKMSLYSKLKEKLDMFKAAAKDEEEFHINYTRRVVR